MSGSEIWISSSGYAQAEIEIEIETNSRLWESH